MPREQIPALDELLGQPIPVLDGGFIRLIDYMGGDASIVQAARISYGRGTKSVREDQALISYLMRHGHTSPFEMCEIKFHIRLPIFVARQWVRHRTASINEYSGRYSVMQDTFYLPEQICAPSATNRQKSDVPLPDDKTADLKEVIDRSSRQCYDAYQELLAQGVARETARLVLPVNYYTNGTGKSISRTCSTFWNYGWQPPHRKKSVAMPGRSPTW